ncbi:unnamed protein product, partial [Didymodactylos carnosus]
MKLGKDVLNRLPVAFFQRCQLVNSAIDMLMKFGDVAHAEHLFQLTKKKTIVTYGAMMQGYVMNDMSEKALNLFEEVSSKSDKVLYVIVFGACASLSNERAIQLGKKLLHQIPTMFLDDIVVVNSAIHMLMKFGEVEDAECLFSVNAYGRNGMGSEAIDLYRQMPQNIRNTVSHICVLNACSHSGLLDQARTIFKEIGTKTEYIIATMIDCLSRMHMFDEAQKLIDDYEKSNSSSWIMYTHDRSHPRSAEIYAELHHLSSELKTHGHEYDSSWITRPLQDGESVESALCGH